MKDILVNYIYREYRSDGFSYKELEYQGYIQHWNCSEHHASAIILNTEGRLHLVPIEDIWVNKSK